MGKRREALDDFGYGCCVKIESKRILFVFDIDKVGEKMYDVEMKS